MWLALCGVLAADACGKIGRQFEFAELTTNALAVSAGNDAEIVFPGEEADDAARASEQWRVFEFVGAGPEAFGRKPSGAREPSGAVNAQPIG